MSAEALKSQRAKERYETIISVSLELFLQNGYENTSLSDIIAKSGGSLSTLYSHFGSKEGLFEAIVDRGILEFYDSLDDYDFAQNCDLREFLTNFALKFVDLALTGESMKFKKMVLAESGKNAKIGEIFYQNGIKKIHNMLVEFFKNPSIKSQLNSDNYELLAFRFCQMLEEPLALSALKGTQFVELSSKERERLVLECVGFFLNGVTKKA